MRYITATFVLLLALFATPSVALAQAGIGGRLAWVTADKDADLDSESFELTNEKITETPIQASLLMKLGAGKVSPFLMGGPGWYRRTVEVIDGPADLKVTDTEFGWHAG